jgi:hypothetical protein
MKVVKFIQYNDLGNVNCRYNYRVVKGINLYKEDIYIHYALRSPS